MIALIQSLLQKMRLSRCKGSLENFPQSLAATLNLQSAGRLNVGGIDGDHLTFLKCSEGRQRCERCPRYKAYEQFVKAYEDRVRDLQVGGATHDGKTDGGNRDRKGAEVAHLNADVACASGVFGKQRDNLQAHAVCNPALPGVKNTQARAKHCKAKGKPFAPLIASHAASLGFAQAHRNAGGAA